MGHPMHDNELLRMLPCAKCKGTDLRIESCKPLGHTRELWRVVCPCGNAAQQWSVSRPAAVRQWNRCLAEARI